MKIQNRFIYKLTDRLGTIIVVPLGESEFTIDYEREDEDKSDYKKQVSGKIIFVKDAFDRIMIMENSIYRCDEQTLSIYKLCNDEEKLIFTGKISLNQAEFNLDKCFVTLKFLDDTKDQCIEDNKSTKINLLNFVYPRREVKLTTAGVIIETKQCNFSSIINNGDSYNLRYWCGTGEPYDQNWDVIKNIVSMEGGISSNPNPVDPEEGISGGMLSVRTKWAREIIEVDCSEIPDPEWVLITDNCGTTGKKKFAKRLDLYDCKTVNQVYTDQWNFRYQESCKYLGGSEGTGVGVQKLRNGILFNGCLTELVKNACPSLIVKSEFFQINPDNVSLINYVTGVKSTVNEIIVFQKSDVKRPTANNVATKLDFDLETMLETILKMFNVKWRIEGNVFRVEHVSYFSKSTGIDVTIESLKKYFAGHRVYSYESENIPQKEKFLFKEQGNNPDYRLEVEYFGCVTNKKKNEVSNVVEDVMTDILLCLSNPDSDNKTVDDNGAVFVSTRKVGGEYYVNSENSPNGRRMNNVFAWAQLFKAFHYYERPMSSGEVNGVVTNFITTIPTKKGDRFAIPLNVCTQNFIPDEYVKTTLGNGIVSSAKYRFKDSFLELELLYESNQNLNPNIPPVLTGGGIYTTYKNTNKIIDVVASDGDGFVTNLQSPQPPIYGTLNFISINQFEYIPNVDFVGDDYFTLQAVDNYSEVSNIVNYLIHVFPPNQPPIAQDEIYDVYQGSPFIQGSSIFANDSDDHGFTLVNSNVTTVMGVNVVIDSGGFFNYTPPVGFDGLDSFQYSIKDDEGLTSTATVTLVVRFKNKPIAVKDNYQTLIDTVFSTNGTLGREKVTKNDYAPDGVTYVFTTIPETKATTAGGSVTITDDGNFTYTPPTGFTGKDSFNYTVLNVNGSATGIVEITVVPMIYVQRIYSDIKYEGIVITCGDPPQQELGGQKQTNDIVLKFFSDAAKTIPFDVTGLDFKVNLRETTTFKYGNNNPTVLNQDYQTGVLSGTTQIVFDDYYTDEEQRDCGFQITFTRKVTFSILSGAYTAVT